MGNCLFAGMGDPAGGSAIKVTTSNGGVMEFFPPITAGTIAAEFPNHAIFRSTHDLFWNKPLSHHDHLLPGNSYHLLPLSGGAHLARQGHVRSSSVPASAPPPYRMSVDYGGLLKRSHTDVLGFWKVKLVISPEQLAEILSQEGKTRELIESVRTVAKCGGAAGGGAVSLGGFSELWSLSSSSRNASSKVDELMLDIIS